MRDEPGLDPARIVFTFDGDAAGQKAAMRAFAEDQRWTAQSFVAVAPQGMDPCDLRLQAGPAAVKALVSDAVPMFEFAVRTLLARCDLASAEGRVQGMKVVAPVINSIKDPSLRPEYQRTVAGWIGVSVEQLADQMRRAGTLQAPQDAPRRRDPEPGEPSAAELAAAYPRPDLRDPIVNAESQLLQVLLQYPNAVTHEVYDAVPPESFVAPAHRAVFDAIRSVVVTEGMTLAQWVDGVTEHAPLAAQPLVSALAVATLPTTVDPATGGPDQRYVDSLVARVREVSLTRAIADSMSLMRRLSSDPDADQAQVRAVSARLQDLQRQRAELREAVS